MYFQIYVTKCKNWFIKPFLQKVGGKTGALACLKVINSLHVLWLQKIKWS